MIVSASETDLQVFSGFHTSRNHVVSTYCNEINSMTLDGPSLSTSSRHEIFAEGDDSPYNSHHSVRS